MKKIPKRFKDCMTKKEAAAWGKRTAMKALNAKYWKARTVESHIGFQISELKKEQDEHLEFLKKNPSPQFAIDKLNVLREAYRELCESLNVPIPKNIEPFMSKSLVSNLRKDELSTLQ